MDMTVALQAPAILPSHEFSLQPGGPGKPGTLKYFDRDVAWIDAGLLQAQFRLPDGGTLVLASDDTPFRERLIILLISHDLRVLDRLLVGGATTPGFLAYAAAHGPDEVAFCWHDLDQVVIIQPYRRLLSRRRAWLRLRDTMSQREPVAS